MIQNLLDRSKRMLFRIQPIFVGGIISSRNNVEAAVVRETRRCNYSKTHVRLSQMHNVRRVLI